MGSGGIFFVMKHEQHRMLIFRAYIRPEPRTTAHEHGGGLFKRRSTKVAVPRRVGPFCCLPLRPNASDSPPSRRDWVLG